MEASSASSPRNNQKNLCDESDDNWFEDGLDDSFDMFQLRREHDKRCNHLHTIGYRDGLISGKEASTQEGFNVGFKESVPIGYRFGLVRGITSALASLPENVKDKLVKTVHGKSKLDKLHETLQLISTKAALKMFHDSILLNDSQSQEYNFHSEDSSSSTLADDTDNEHLGRFSRDLESLLQELPSIRLHSEMQNRSE